MLRIPTDTFCASAKKRREPLRFLPRWQLDGITGPVVAIDVLRALLRQHSEECSSSTPRR
jgi:hypothetical protein